MQQDDREAQVSHQPKIVPAAQHIRLRLDEDLNPHTKEHAAQPALDSGK